MKKRQMRRKNTLTEESRFVSKTPIFDFDLGTLLESPCRTCETRSMLPYCQENCKLLAGIQTILADSINSGQSVLPVESYSVMVRER